MARALLLIWVDHLMTLERYIPMIESLMPAPALVVLVTGMVEKAGAAGLLIPSLRRRASIAIAVYLLAVFPANLANALLGLTAEGLPVSQNYYWFRLALQPLFIWWALVAGRILPLPSPWRRGI